MSITQGSFHLNIPAEVRHGGNDSGKRKKKGAHRMWKFRWSKGGAKSWLEPQNSPKSEKCSKTIISCVWTKLNFSVKLKKRCSLWKTQVYVFEEQKRFKMIQTYSVDFNRCLLILLGTHGDPWRPMATMATYMATLTGASVAHRPKCRLRGVPTQAWGEDPAEGSGQEGRCPCGVSEGFWFVGDESCGN